MRLWKKALSVGLSLTLCAGLVAPSFAMADLSERDEEGNYKYIGYMSELDGNKLYEVSWLRSHQVVNEDGSISESYDYYLGNDMVLDRTLEIGYDYDKMDEENCPGYVGSASIDLNGHELALNKGMTVEVDEETHYVTVKLDGKTVAVHNEEGKVIEGAADVLKRGSVIVFDGSTIDCLTVTDRGVDGVERGGHERGVITGGYLPKRSKGEEYDTAVIRAASDVHLTGVEISNNYCSYGVLRVGFGEGVLTDVKISDNAAVKSIIFAGSCGDVTLNQVEVTDNTATGSTSCILYRESNPRSDATISGCKFAGNDVGYFTYWSLGICSTTDSTFCGNSFTGGMVFGTTENYYGGVTFDESTQQNTFDDHKTEWRVVTPAKLGEAGLEALTCTVCGHVTETREIPARTETGTGGGFSYGVTEIEDVAVPLAAGPVTRAEFIDYLWRHEGEPETDGVCTFTDVPADHEFILALAWAEQNGIAVADEEGNFEPDELVTVAAVREILGNFARVFEMDVDVFALTTLTGEDDEAVLNCDEVIAEFFGEELALAA